MVTMLWGRRFSGLSLFFLCVMLQSDPADCGICVSSAVRGDVVSRSVTVVTVSHRMVGYIQAQDILRDACVVEKEPQCLPSRKCSANIY